MASKQYPADPHNILLNETQISAVARNLLAREAAYIYSATVSDARRRKLIKVERNGNRNPRPTRLGLDRKTSSVFVDDGYKFHGTSSDANRYLHDTYLNKYMVADMCLLLANSRL